MCYAQTTSFILPVYRHLLNGIPSDHLCDNVSLLVDHTTVVGSLEISIKYSGPVDCDSSAVSLDLCEAV